MTREDLVDEISDIINSNGYWSDSYRAAKEIVEYVNERLNELRAWEIGG